MNAMKQVLVLAVGLAVVVLLVSAGRLNTAGDSPRAIQRRVALAVCGQGPTHPPTAKIDDLDESVLDWGIYCDGEGTPTPIIENVSMPSIDGTSLHCGIAGGDPYSNVHCYRNLLPEPSTNVFTLTLKFWFSPTTCNNEQTRSKVQALEFTMSKWYRGQRYEFAVQWLNVGNGAPQWRYWDPHRQLAQDRWVPLSPSFTQCLQGGTGHPHTLTLEGAIAGGQVQYRRLTVDDQSRVLAITLAPKNENVPDGLAVAIQLDGNVAEDPYDVYIDEVRLIRNFQVYLPLLLK